MFKRKLILLILLVFPLSLNAKEKQIEPTGVRKEAIEFLNSMNLEETMSQSINQLVDIQIKQQPQLENYRNVLLAFLTKYMSYQNIKEDLIKIYSEAFTEQELKDINAFYKTETGKKVITKIPELMSKGAQLGSERVNAHKEELKQMIEKASQKKGRPN